MARRKTGSSRPAEANTSSRKYGYQLGRDRLVWRSGAMGLSLYCGKDRNPLATLETDSKYARLYRIRYPDGEFSDFVNLTRAKDAAMAFALRVLNPQVQDSGTERHRARHKGKAVSSAPLPSSRISGAANGFLAT